jgi:hypothetical protein
MYAVMSIRKFGDFTLALTLSILIGSIPGVYLGSRLSASAPDVGCLPLPW